MVPRRDTVMAQSPLVLTAAGLVPLGALLLGVSALPVPAQEAGYGQTLGAPQQRNLFDGDLGGDEDGLDLNNPLNLIDRLRRGTAMDDATPPGDAVDAALREFESRGASPASPAPAASPAAP
jgi:hypothetical protein